MKEGRVPDRKTLLLILPSKKYGSNLTTLFRYLVYIVSDCRMIDGLKSTGREMVVA
jgi:hypothetical protein